jgi:hypothetical protein
MNTMAQMQAAIDGRVTAVRGAVAHATGRPLEVPVGDAVLGRPIDLTGAIGDKGKGGRCATPPDPSPAAACGAERHDRGPGRRAGPDRLKEEAMMLLSPHDAAAGPGEREPDAERLRELAAWYREFAERTENPVIWAARLQTAEKLEEAADRLENRRHRCENRA